MSRIFRFSGLFLFAVNFPLNAGFLPSEPGKEIANGQVERLSLGLQPSSTSSFLKNPIRKSSPRREPAHLSPHRKNNGTVDESAGKDSDGPSRWDFNGTDLTQDEMDYAFEGGEPDAVVYFRGDQRIQILPKDKKEETGFTLYLADQRAVDRVKEERLQRMRERLSSSGSSSMVNSFSSSPSDDSVGEDSALDEEAYVLRDFKKGLRDDRVQWISTIGDPNQKIYGPDYSTSLDEAGAIASVLSAGHGGEILLEVSQGGILRDRDGFDFTIYENVFRYDSGKLWQEFAFVGVSMTERPDDFVWFDCDPDRGRLVGCAGAVPTEDGGDQFDLGEVGLKSIRFIKLRDRGNNKNKGANKEGFDLDAGRLNHAVLPQN